MGILLADAAQGGGASSILVLVGYLAIFGVAIYFLMIRPQKKEQSKREAMYAAMAVGDIVVTTSGFYGEIIDITDDAVIFHSPLIFCK